MYIYLPDPFPGRCMNFRFQRESGQNVRCLDYEGAPHICTFPEPPPRTYTWTQTSSTVMTEKPQPWVKPGGTEPADSV